MGWLDRVKDRVSKVISDVKARVYESREDREIERRVVFERERIVEERFKVTVYEKEPTELRPFSSLFQYGVKTGAHRDRSTGRFVSKTQYEFELSQWRQTMAGQYIERAHPDWSEREITEAILRLEELRAKPVLSPLEDIEIGALFYAG